MPERALEPEVWGLVGVVFGEFHRGFEVAAVVEGVRVEDNKGDTPFEDVVMDEGDVGPGFLGEGFVFVHEDFVGHVGVRACLSAKRVLVDGKLELRAKGG